MNKLYINEDAWCFFADRASAPWHCPVTVTMDEAGLRQQMEYYAVPGVTGILFNGNAMRAFFDSTAFEPLWEGMTEGEDGRFYFHGKPIEAAGEGPENFLQLCTNAKKLFENVKDPFRFRRDFCKARKIEMWISMRMNDVHHVDAPDRIMHTTLWREHPELRRAYYRTTYAFWFAQCFDYAREEVRRHHMNLVEEYLDRFEMDGFELDWMRSPFHFKPGFAEQGTPLLTDFMREVKRRVDAAAKRFGHPIKIGVRVPARPEEALQAGLDIFTWAREGLVDLVTPSPYFQSSSSTLPVGIWKRLLPAEVTLAPCLEQHIGGGGEPGGWMRSTVEADTGFANSYFHQGADAIYLFNHMFRDGLADLDRQRESYTYLGDPEETARRPRRHVATPHEGIIESSTSQCAFHGRLSPGGYASIRLDIGNGSSGRTGRVLLGRDAGTPAPTFEVRVNTAPCRELPDFRAPELPETIAAQAFEIPPEAIHDGENVIEARNLSAETVLLHWAELDLD